MSRQPRIDNQPAMCQDVRRSGAYPMGCINESSAPCAICGDPMCPDHLERVFGRKVCHACVLRESFDLLAKGEEILRANGDEERADTLAAGALDLQIGAVAFDPPTEFQIAVCHDPICSAAVDFERWALRMLAECEDVPPNVTAESVIAVMRQFIAWALREKRMEVMYSNIEGRVN